MMGASCHRKGGKGDRASPKVRGIVTGHAYAILDLFTIEGTQLIQLKNPWSSSEWTGDWGDSTPQWTERAKQQVQERMKSRGVDITQTNKDDGVFWMSFADFFNTFTGMDGCKYFDDSEWGKIEF